MSLTEVKLTLVRKYMNSNLCICKLNQKVGIFVSLSGIAQLLSRVRPGMLVKLV